MRSAGVLYMAASAFFFSLMGLLVKVAGHSLPAQQIVLARVVVTLTLSWVMLRRAGLRPWGNRRAALAFRGLFGALALACFYWSITRLALAEATTIQMAAPLLTAVLAAFVLRERLNPVAVVAIVVGLSGVVLVAQPSPSGFAIDRLTLAVAVLGACSSASAYVTVRQLSQHEDPLVIVFYFPLIALPLSIAWTWGHWVWPTGWQWLVLLGVGISTQIGQVCMTRGLRLEPAGRASAISYLQVAFAMLWGIGLGEVPTPMTIAGAALIVVATLIVAANRSR